VDAFDNEDGERKKEQEERRSERRRRRKENRRMNKNMIVFSFIAKLLAGITQLLTHNIT